jgi:hypothetical protein
MLFFEFVYVVHFNFEMRYASPAVAWLVAAQA